MAERLTGDIAADVLAAHMSKTARQEAAKRLLDLDALPTEIRRILDEAKGDFLKGDKWAIVRIIRLVDWS